MLYGVVRSGTAPRHDRTGTPSQGTNEVLRERLRGSICVGAATAIRRIIEADPVQVTVVPANR